MKNKNNDMPKEYIEAYQAKIDSESTPNWTVEQEEHHQKILDKVKIQVIDDFKAQGREDLIKKLW